MLTNYIKIALRSISKNKLHTIINVAGLSIGLASVFLMAFYIQYETGYDKFYPEPENLYRITWENENPQTRTPHPMAQALVTDFPEVESAVSLSPLWAAGLTRETFSIHNPEKDLRFDESNILAVDTTFFEVFGFPTVRGNGRQALKNINGIILTQTTAKKYFGDENPMGKQLAVYPDSVFLEVMAVVEDVPKQSHIQFDFLISYLREKSFDPEDSYYSWADFGHYNYIRLKRGTNPKALEGKLMPWIRKYINVSDEQFAIAVANNIGFRVQPVTDIHLKSHLRWELEPNGNIEYVYIMVAAALLTLIIACINFMNLMTAKSADRAKEIAIRKSMGALRQQLSLQFLSESVFISLMAIVVAVLLLEGALPFYNSLTGHSISLIYAEVLPGLLLFGLLMGLLSGIYPALILSGIQPHGILKGKFQTSGSGNRLRSTLIVVQFAISMILLSGALIIFNQLDYIRNKNLGFNQEELVVVPLKNADLSRRIETIRTELLKIKGITAVSASSNMPGGQFNQNGISLVEKPQNEISCSEVFVDYEFLKVMNIELTEGRFFEYGNLEDSTLHFVINESAARQLNTPDIIGKELHWYAYDDDRPVRGSVIGVVKDFHFQSLHDPLRPLLMVLNPAYNHLLIRLNPENFDDQLAQIQDVYEQVDPNFIFEFDFLSDRLNKQYEAEQRTGLMFSIFAFLAMAIACFGLFAIAMLSFHQRVKEISVRKVLGASLFNLMVLLLKDFTRLIVVAVMLASPVAWWMMNRWLSNFIYQVEIYPSVFLVSGISLVLLAWLTLSYLTLKTSRVNPAETLKAE